MRLRALQVTYRQGRPLVAWFSLHRGGRSRTDRVREYEPGLVIDLDAAGTPIGVEILDPEAITLERFNAVLAELGIDPVDEADLRPLHAA